MNKSEPNIPSQTPKMQSKKKCLFQIQMKYIDKDRLISDYYARGSCEFINGVCFKDLSLLDRPMEDAVYQTQFLLLNFYHRKKLKDIYEITSLTQKQYWSCIIHRSLINFRNQKKRIG